MQWNTKEEELDLNCVYIQQASNLRYKSALKALLSTGAQNHKKENLWFGFVAIVDCIFWGESFKFFLMPQLGKMPIILNSQMPDILLGKDVA